MKQRRGIRSPLKVVIRAGIFLLLGAVVNVAVAWGLALAWSMDPGDWRSSHRYHDNGSWAVHKKARVGGVALKEARVEVSDHAYRQMANRGPHPSELTPTWAGLERPTPEFLALDAPKVQTRIVHARGWPLLALWWEEVHVGIADGPSTKYSRFALHTPLPAFARVGIIEEPRALPLMPIWLGFALNTLLYAAVLWLLFAAPFALRRWRRSKRGLCPTCAYPVGASEVCTECGKPVKVTKIEPSAL